MHVLMAGEMGAGKTTIGQRVARALGWPFVDNDRLMLARTGRSADQWATETDLATLHRHELEACAVAVNNPTPSVIAVAASVIDTAEGLALLRDSGVVVWLRAPAETRLQRMKAEPELESEGLRPRALVAELRTAPSSSSRAERFASVADVVVDTYLYSARQVTRIVYRALEHALDPELMP